MGENVGGLEILGGRTKKLAEQNIAAGERVLFCLVGEWRQSLVALERRLFIIKTGYMSGATFGGRVTSFDYQDITAVEVNTGLMTGVIEIATPSYQATAQKDFWNIRDQNKDPYKVSNCLPISKFELKKFRPYVEQLRTLVSDAKGSRNGSAAHAAGDGVADQLGRLAELHRAAILSDEQFEQAKRKVLNG